MRQWVYARAARAAGASLKDVVFAAKTARFSTLRLEKRKMMLNLESTAFRARR
jgi:hypothetical protein